MRVNVDRYMRMVVISGVVGNGAYEIVLTHEQAMAAARLIQAKAELIVSEPGEGKTYAPISSR